MAKLDSRCFNEEEQYNVRTNYLIDTFKELFNHTSQLGLEVIDDCPALVQEEDGVLQVLTGSEACSFVEYEKRRRDWDKCQNDALGRRGLILSLLSLSAAPL